MSLPRRLQAFDQQESSRYLPTPRHVLEGRGRIDEATDNYRSMLALSQDLLRIDAGNREWVQQSGLAHNNLAKMALLRGDLKTAVAEYKADVDIQAELARRDPLANDQDWTVVYALRLGLGRTP